MNHSHLDSPEQVYELVRSHRMRLTEQRKAVIQVFFESPIALTANELKKKLKSLKVAVDDVSIYRIIEAFTEVEILHELRNRKYQLCHHTQCQKEAHLSLICRKCQKSHEPAIQKSKLLDFLKENRVKISSDVLHVEVHYICESCA